MKIKQLSVFIENTTGRLYEICALLGSKDINIRALTIAESPEFGIVRLVVDKTEDAVNLLKEFSIITKVADIVALEVSDKPGGLSRALKVLNDNNINIEYMYGFVEKATDNALMVFKFEDTDKAIEVLQKNNIKIVTEQEVKGI
jgi:hypothetical protein